MLSKEKQVTIELIETKNSEFSKTASNPIIKNTTGLSNMVTKILDDELPMLKNNSLLHDLVLYTLQDKMNTVQNVKNVLSYIKDNGVKEINDVYFKEGEICIKCLI